MKGVMLKEALRYLEMGLSVIPLRHKDKKPLTSWDDYQKRRSQEWEVEEWWATWPDANIGIVTGKVSGLVVVDVDGEKGLETAKRLGLPETPTVKTGKGEHYYYRHSGNGEIRNVQKKDSLPGIDLRGDGGYVVAPPSIHPSGEAYQWVIPLDSMPLALLPESVLAIGLSDKTPVRELVKGVPEGGRNNALASIAGTLFAKGLDYGNVLQLCLAWNTYNKPPLADKEVDTTVESIYKTHLRNHPVCSRPEGDNSKTTGNNSSPLRDFAGKKETFKPPKPLTELEDAPSTSWHWEEYLPAGETTLFTGYWKSGKSTFLGALLSETLEGGEFLGYEVAPMKVLIVSEESESIWKTRAYNFGLGENIHLVSRPFMYKPTTAQWRDFLGYVGGLIESHGYNLIILDTLAALWPVRDENSASEVTQTLMPVRQWNEKGVSVLLVHHFRKGDGQEGQGDRGSGALASFVDVKIEFRRYDRESQEDTRRVVTVLSRYEIPPEQVIRLEENKYISLGTKKEAGIREREQVYQEILPHTSPGLTVEETLDAWPDDDKKPGKGRVGSDLASFPWVRREGQGKRGSPYRYRKVAPETLSSPENPIGGGINNSSLEEVTL